MEKKKFIKIGTATEHNTPLITDIIINTSLLYFISIGKVESSLVAHDAPIDANEFKYSQTIFIFLILGYFKNPKDTHCLESSEIYCIQRMLFLVLV